jgi:hypothetical protein
MKRKCLAVGIILLFLGTSILSSTGYFIVSNGMKEGNARDSPPDEEWNRTYSYPSGCTGGNCIQQTPDGGYVVTGYAGGGNHYSFYLLKVDQLGNEQWNRTFGSGYIEANWVEVTSDNGYIITGRLCQWTGEEYETDVWLIKTDVNGNEEWNKTFGGIGEQWGNCVKQTMDGGYILTGAHLVDDTDRLLLVKTDALGSELWTKTYGNQSLGYSLVLTTDGGYMITGDNDSALLLMKTYENGTVEWEKKFFYNFFFFSRGTCIQKTFDGGYIIGGDADVSWPSDLLLLKTDENGIEEWNRTFPYSGTDWGTTVIQTINGDYVLGGTQETSRFWLIRTNPQGSVVWEKVYLPSFYARCNCVQQTPDDGFIVTGVINPFSADRCVILKLNAGNNHPPSSSTIKGPHWGLIDTNYSFCINATDLDGDALYCTWDWGDENFSDWLGPYSPNVTICVNHSWSQKGKYELRVKIKDRFGHESNWSDIHFFNVYELQKAFIFGRYTLFNESGNELTIVAVNIWALYKEPISFAHYPTGTHVTFLMDTIHGRMFQKIGLLFLRVDLIV